MQSKNAIGNLKNRYLAVLKKCNLLNTFGSLAVVSMLVTGAATGSTLMTASVAEAAEIANNSVTWEGGTSSDNALYESGTVNVSVGGTIGDLTVKSGSAAVAVTLSGKQSHDEETYNVNGNLEVNSSGALVVGSGGIGASTLNVRGTSTIGGASGALTIVNGTYNAYNKVSIGASGSLTVSGAAAATDFAIANIYSDLDIVGSGTSGAAVTVSGKGTLNVTGTTLVGLSGGITVNGANAIANLGVLNVSGDTSAVTVTQGVLNANGLVTIGSGGTLTALGAAPSNTAVINAKKGLSVTDHGIVNVGADDSASGGILNVFGDMSVAGANSAVTIGSGNGTGEINVTGNFTLASDASGTSFALNNGELNVGGNLVDSRASGGLTAAENTEINVVKNLSITKGTLEASGGAIFVKGDVAITSGDMTNTSGSINVGGNVTLTEGNYLADDSGSITHIDGTLNIAKGTFTNTSGSTTFGNLTGAGTNGLFASGFTINSGGTVTALNNLNLTEATVAIGLNSSGNGTLNVKGDLTLKSGGTASGQIGESGSINVGKTLYVGSADNTFGTGGSYTVGALNIAKDASGAVPTLTLGASGSVATKHFTFTGLGENTSFFNGNAISVVGSSNTNFTTLNFGTTSGFALGGSNSTLALTLGNTSSGGAANVNAGNWTIGSVNVGTSGALIVNGGKLTVAGTSVSSGGAAESFKFGESGGVEIKGGTLEVHHSQLYDADGKALASFTSGAKIMMDAGSTGTLLINNAGTSALTIGQLGTLHGSLASINGASGGGAASGYISATNVNALEATVGTGSGNFQLSGASNLASGAIAAGAGTAPIGAIASSVLKANKVNLDITGFGAGYNSMIFVNESRGAATSGGSGSLNVSSKSHGLIVEAFGTASSNYGDDAKITLAENTVTTIVGTGGNLVIDTKGNLADVSGASGSSLVLAGGSGTLGDVDLDTSGAFAVQGGRYTLDKLTIASDAHDVTINNGASLTVNSITSTNESGKSVVGSLTDGFATLTVGELIGGDIVATADLSKNEVSRVAIGSVDSGSGYSLIADIGSQIAVGSKTIDGKSVNVTANWIDTEMKEAGLSMEKDYITSVFGVYGTGLNIAAGSSGAIYVGGNSGAGVSGNGIAAFNDDSLFVVDGGITGAALTVSGGAGGLVVKEDAKLLITNVGQLSVNPNNADGTSNTPSTTITIASGSSIADLTHVEGWGVGETDATIDKTLFFDSVFLKGTTSLAVTNTVTVQVEQVLAKEVMPLLDSSLAAHIDTGIYEGVTSAGMNFIKAASVYNRDMFGVYTDAQKASNSANIEGAVKMGLAGDAIANTATISNTFVDNITKRTSFSTSYVANSGVVNAGAIGTIGEGEAYKSGTALWFQPMYKSTSSDGFESGNFEYGYDGDFYGASVGGDYTFANDFRLGAAFHIGSGSNESTGSFAKTENDFDYVGFGVFAGKIIGNFGVSADMGYTMVSNEVKQNNAVSHLKADFDSSTFTIGTKLEYFMGLPSVDIIPHIGLRMNYTSTDAYNTNLATGLAWHTESMDAMTFAIPLGVTLQKDIATGSLILTPSLDLGMQFAFGDTDVEQNVHIAGVSGHASMESDVFDPITFKGGLGLGIGYTDNISFNLDYDINASSNVVNQGVTASFTFKF